MQRAKPSEFIRGMSTAIDCVYNERSGTLKTLGPVMGCLMPMGQFSSVKVLEKGLMIAFYNSDSTVHFVRFGDDPSTLIASSDYAEAIPIPPQQFLVLSNGSFIACIADSNTVYAYRILDESTLK